MCGDDGDQAGLVWGRLGDCGIGGEVEQDALGRVHELGDPGAAVTGFQLEIWRELSEQRVWLGVAGRHRVPDIGALDQLADVTQLPGLAEQFADVLERFGVLEYVAEQFA